MSSFYDEVREVVHGDLFFFFSEVEGVKFVTEEANLWREKEMMCSSLSVIFFNSVLFLTFL